MADEEKVIGTGNDSYLEELAQLSDQRAATYGMLSRLYRTEVDQELLDQMQETLYPAATGNKDVDEGHLLIATHLSNLWDNSLTELAVDYARTFIGHGVDAYSAAYPYESVYTSERRLVMQDARDEVLHIYRKAHLNKANEWRDGEDHVALELEFEQILCKRASKALRNGEEEKARFLFEQQSSFLEGHLLSWVPMMTADIRRFSHTDMYRGLASLTEGFLDVDKAFLTDLLGDAGEAEN